MKNFEFGDTQYTQGLTSDYYRGDPGDWAENKFFSMDGTFCLLKFYMVITSHLMDILISRSNVENGLRIRMGPFVNSSHLMDIVHFQDLSLSFHRTDPYHYFDISYDAFQLSFPWLRNSDSQYSISQKLMDMGRN